MITPRLAAIIEMVNAKTIADVGTDHAFIPIRLARDKIIKQAIATDKNKGPLESAKKNVEKYSLADIIELRLGAGLEPLLAGEAEEIIIAGMGGNLIADIIEENVEKAKASTLILQPMNDQYELRKRLFEMGFTIGEEELCAEGFKVYNLMKVYAKPQNTLDTEIHLHLPETLRRHKLWDMLADKKEREFSKIINGQRSAENPNYEIIEKYEGLLEELNIIRKK